MEKRSRPTLRPMRQEDLPAVAGIERQAMSPWSLTALEREMAAVNGRQLVAESHDLQLLGWCAWRTIWPEAELLKIAVAADMRKKGLGSELLEAVLQELQGQACRTLFLEVRARNAAAIQFYQKHGFRQVGRRPGYYEDPPDDALILQREL